MEENNWKTTWIVRSKLCLFQTRFLVSTYTIPYFSVYMAFKSGDPELKVNGLGLSLRLKVCRQQPLWTAMSMTTTCFRPCGGVGCSCSENKEGPTIPDDP